MDKTTFLVVLAFMISTVCLTKIQDFNCSGKEYNIALVYDCSYSLQLQRTFFFQFLYRFKSLQFYINVILMTYGRSNLLTFGKLTQENMTWDTFDEALLQLNTSSCPQHLPLNTLFNDTRDALSGVNETVIKLAIFVLSESLTEYENDDVTMLRWLENEPGLNVDVKRLFILVKPSVELEIKNQTLIYTSALKNSAYMVKTIIQHVCNVCSEDDLDVIKIDGNCYHFLSFKYELTAWEANLLCQEHLPYTGLVSFNSKLEHEHFISKWCILLEAIANDCRKGEMLYDNDIVCNASVVNGTQVITFDVFIGLLRFGSNVSEYYKWSEGTPLTFDPPWGSRNEGYHCVYMSKKYYYTGDKLTRGKLEWNEINCHKRQSISFVTCKTDRIDVKKRSLNLQDVKSKKTKSKVHFLYTSYSPVFFNFINNELKNTMFYDVKKDTYLHFFQKECKNICQKYKESNETYVSENIESNSEMFLSIPSRDNSCEINQICCPTLLLNSYNHKCRLFREREMNSKVLNNKSSFENTYLIDPGRNIATCLYEKDVTLGKVAFTDTTHLQDCEQFLCPPGFIKCPGSYCIHV